ncbi:hypothetical protein NKL07_18005 [Mesorhizobium sp. C280B]|uniref:hypothetical protein n=1 Tax=unclassified Mesorhizobium TaxID=325217 RepID=UPI0003CEE462|nr:hypothetical protein [Mesorhizobium sp. LSJC280B00]ESW80726.1 hypothetical protein X772_24290 [Mesorhizobium sp. LSJC280B00]
MLARQIGGRRKIILALPDADRPAGLRTYVSVDAAKFVAQPLDAQLLVDAALAVKTDRTFCQIGARCLLTWSSSRAAICWFWALGVFNLSMLSRPTVAKRPFGNCSRPTAARLSAAGPSLYFVRDRTA